MKFMWFGLLLLVGNFMACDSSYVHQERKEIPDGQWAKKEPLTFSLDASKLDSSAAYAVGISMRYHTMIKHNNIKLLLEMLPPEGETVMQNYDLALRDENGKPVGEEMGDIGDYAHVLLPRLEFKQAGNYQFRITQAMDNMEELGGVVSLELFVEKLTE